MKKPKKKIKMLNQKRGWIRIVEAFVAILLITGVALLVINKGYFGKTDISEKVYDVQWQVLREIELNDESRNKVLSAQVDSEGNDVPEEIRTRIENRIPDYLECVAKICDLDKLCEITSPTLLPEEKDIYAQPIAIAVTAKSTTFDPRQLKLFCWVK